VATAFYYVPGGYDGNNNTRSVDEKHLLRLKRTSGIFTHGRKKGQISLINILQNCCEKQV